ncbi:MAG TPA: hypothetical protein VMB71_15175 [Acetobacteraceae bacterium]|nr:hypothetical protein [Acetobacteraceae bacterium]
MRITLLTPFLVVALTLTAAAAWTGSVGSFVNDTAAVAGLP